ncbi:MAG: hypothetical protein KA993_00060 [Neisseria sp.]|nr:hypothetical protein [Neisseria sp.]
MNTNDFNRLCRIFMRFTAASPRWPAILVHLIDRCDGFVEDFTLNEIQTASHLLDKTEELLQSLPNSANDLELIELLAQEFEGLYLTAVSRNELWNSLTESYANYKQRVRKVADIGVTSEPHVPIEQSRRYLSNLLGNDALRARDYYQ